MKQKLMTYLFVVSLFGFLGAPQVRSDSAAEIDAEVQATLAHFYRHVGGSSDLVGRAAGVLVFPNVVRAGMGVGGEYGEGALQIRGKPEGYYNTVSLSIGFQLGVEKRSVIIAFMTDDALAKFRRAHGWSIGVDGSVTLITIGVGGSIDTSQVNSPVIGFIFDEKGLMYNLTLEGTKISPIRR